MKRSLAAGVLVALWLWAPDAPAIENGTLDNGDAAVVAVLASDGQGGFGACSGTVVGVANGLASVLTAASCCSPLVPTIVVTGRDYSAGEAYVANPSSALPPAYAVIASSVKVDPRYVPGVVSATDDFCMLRFAAPANLVSLPVAVGADGLTPGVSIRYVGFGITSINNQTNTQRYTVVTTLSSLDANSLQSTGSGRACNGDTGGPVLAGSSPTVVGVIAYSDSTCSQFTQSARATSETGTSGFISSYLASSAGAPSVPASPRWTIALLGVALVAAGIATKRLRGRTS
jgi:hypothetical protein